MSEVQTFAERIKAETRADHEAVDNIVLSMKPFHTPENYINFLKLQSVFHYIVDEIYADETLNKKIPHLKDLARYNTVLQDLKDLNATPYQYPDPLPKPTGQKAIGWLYCAEGSNLGAAFLLKHANTLDFNETHGARHLAAHPDGRGPHWREFVKHLNNLGLTVQEQDEAITGAKEAFAFYQQVLRKIFNFYE